MAVINRKNKDSVVLFVINKAKLSVDVKVKIIVSMKIGSYMLCFRFFL